MGESVKRMHEVVAFDAPTSAPDGYGGTEVGWAEQFETRAHFLYLRGGETVQAARLAGKQPIVATIRASDAARAVSPGYRLRDVRRGVEYNVRAVVETEDRQFIEVTAESGVAV